MVLVFYQYLQPLYPIVFITNSVFIVFHFLQADYSSCGVRALVLVPTKELAKQAHKNIKVQCILVRQM